MSATVTYKGNVITTVSNETKTLTTSGTWLEGNISITDVSDGTGVIYQDEDGYLVIPDEGDTIIKINEFISGVFDNTDITTNSSTIRKYAFYGTNITSFKADNVTSLGSGNALGIFQNCTSLKSISMQNLTSIGNSQYFLSGCTSLETVDFPSLRDTGDYAFQNCTSLVTVVLPSASGGYRSFHGCTNLQQVDYGRLVGSEGMNVQNFYNCGKLKTVILRNNSSSVTNLLNVNAFQNTPFASGGTGGILYVPSALISSYQSATNWSTILGYENNQILSIEGSVYETKYADGTPIQSN